MVPGAADTKRKVVERRKEVWKNFIMNKGFRKRVKEKKGFVLSSKAKGRSSQKNERPSRIGKEKKKWGGCKNKDLFM